MLQAGSAANKWLAAAAQNQLEAGGGNAAVAAAAAKTERLEQILQLLSTRKVVSG